MSNPALPAHPEMAAASRSHAVCPVCGGADFVAMFGAAKAHAAPRRAEPYRITQSSRMLVGAVERCRGCGLGRLPPHLVEGHYAEGADERFAQQGEVRCRNAERLLQLLPPPAPRARLLDVGSAYGFLLIAAHRLGYDAVGVEPSREAARYARETYGVEVFNGPVQDVPAAVGRFDVVTLADVIEHLVDPAAVIEALQRLLRPGGRLVILTPDLDSFMARWVGRHWWTLLDDHYFYFSRRTLPRFLAQHGFVSERLQSFGRSFPLRHWAFKLSQYNDGLHRMVARLLETLRLADVEVPLNLGDQMVCVARKVAEDG